MSGPEGSGNHRCPVCGGDASVEHVAREMMHGTKDAFTYRECGLCGGLSLATPPADMSHYYPQDYYSLAPRGESRIRSLRDRVYMSRLSWLVNWKARLDLDALLRSGFTRGMSLLDVGCGAGHTIGDLRDIGFDAHGIDPFVAKDLVDRFGVRVRKCGLDEVRGAFDRILFCHSLEHIPDQVQTLRQAFQLLKPDGVVVVMVPVVGWAWKQYGVNWVQLDAPRHWFLHTRKSMETAAAEAGLRVDRVVYDSDDFQFWASELYHAGKPLRGTRRPGAIERLPLRRRAARLNRSGGGDRAQFFLKAR